MKLTSLLSLSTMITSLITFLLSFNIVYAQTGVAVNTSGANADASAILDV